MGLNNDLLAFAAMQSARDTGQHLIVTEAMARWNAGGRVITEEAWRTVAEVSRDVITLADGTTVNADGVGRIRPSSIAGCKRRIFLSYLGYEADPFANELLDIMDAGTDSHRKWQRRGLSIGLFTGIEVLLEDNYWLLKGRADAVMSDGSVFELKTCSPQKFRNYCVEGPEWKHKLQAACYMEALGVEWASIVYEDRGLLRWKEFRLHYDDLLRSEVKNLKQFVRGHLDRQELPAMLPDCRVAKGEVYRDCGHREACPTAVWF